MPVPTPGYVKNIIRRCFQEQVDKSPTKKQTTEIWEYFDSTCAYCGVALNRGNKEGHIDHLVSASQGGSNNVSNRVLSCARCNEKEKRDKNWKEFLEKKVIDEDKRKERIERITRWVELQTQEGTDISEKLLHTAGDLARESEKIFDDGINTIRSLK